MPIYDGFCNRCQEERCDVYAKMGEPLICPVCGSDMTKAISPVGFKFNCPTDTASTGSSFAKSERYKYQKEVDKTKEKKYNESQRKRRKK
jgi:predicted nucleic acid-binding Zn ribbon protein